MSLRRKRQEPPPIPSVSPEKRGSCWYACYAAAFMAQYLGSNWPAPKMHAARARLLADIAVDALTQIDKENADG